MTTNPNRVDLSAAWDSLWGSLTAFPGASGLFALLGVIGGAIAGWAVVQSAWHRFGPDRGGRMVATDRNIYLLVLACLLTAPTILLPILFNVVDVLANAVANVFTNGA